MASRTLLLRHLSDRESMKRVLGIFDGTHDAGACLLVDGKVIAACDEERWTRKKGQGGFPKESIDWIFKFCNLSWKDIDEIAVAGFINPNPVLRFFRPVQQKWKLDNGQFYAPNQWASNWLQFQSPFPYLRPKQNTPWKLFRRLLEKSIQRDLYRIYDCAIPSISIHEHHLCHAASAHFTAGHQDSLIVVADGIGDGLALSIWLGSKQHISKCFEIPFPHSLGLMYASITGYLGYKPFRHEGKLTGLAATGQAKNISIPFPFTGPFPHRSITTNFPMYEWLQQLDGQQPEDIAAWLQAGIEAEIMGILHWAKIQFGNRPLLLAGGLMANVSLNARISRELQPPDLFIFPNMGDAGLATGAAYVSGSTKYGWTPKQIDSVYWGPETEVDACTHRILKSEDATPKSIDQLLTLAANALAEGKIIARAVGRMEYGPRALGNRSIICSARSRAIHKHLNHLLNRSDIMPFAPIMRHETAEKWLHIPESSWTAMEWMTITAIAKPELAKRCPAVVHVDNTLRPQLITQSKQPILWKLLKTHEELTGEPALINTSFNRHEEPIVCSADDAIQAFLASNLDALWLENRWIERKT